MLPYYHIRPSNGRPVPVRPVSTYGYGVVTVTVRCRNSPVNIRVTVRYGTVPIPRNSGPVPTTLRRSVENTADQRILTGLQLSLRITAAHT